MAENFFTNQLIHREEFIGGFEVKYINSLSWIKQEKPFNGVNDGRDIFVITDIDGVIPVNDDPETLIDLEALSLIGEMSKKVIFHTSRLSCNNSREEENSDYNRFSIFPLISRNSLDNLRNLVKKRNSDCDVSLVSGLSKIVGSKGLIIDKSEEIFRNGGLLVMIGSSIFDIRTAKKIYRRNTALVRSGVNFFCYNIGYLLK